MPEPTAPLFSAPSREPERRFPLGTIVGAIALVAVLVGFLIVLGKRHQTVDPTQAHAMDPYAGFLALEHLQMSESTSLSGGKSTFLDGDITNRGRSVVTAATAQVFFANDEQLPPHIETVSVALIRSREPYIDTQPLAAAPLAPGESRPFRLIFESIPSNWNSQMPEVRLVSVSLRDAPR